MTVQLINHMGDDLSIVNAARVSFHKESNYDYVCEGCGKVTPGEDKLGLCMDCDPGGIVMGTQLKAADAGLINFLMKNRHGTPFEMVQLQFRVSVPIFVAREWQRHRIGSYNEMSTRYVEMEPTFYVPKEEHIRVQVGRPGHYTYETADATLAASTVDHMNAAYMDAYATYSTLLSKGVAKEVARNVLPLAQMTEFIWSVNLRSLFNFVSLRNHDRALLEIRLEAQEVEALARQVAPCAMEAFDRNERVAP